MKKGGYKEWIHELRELLQKKKMSKKNENPQPNDTTKILARNTIIFQHMTTTASQLTARREIQHIGK